MQRLGICGVYRRRYEDDPSSHIDCVPQTVTPPSYASLLLQNGESAVYVKDQMGHCSIQVTVDLYGHLIPGGNRQAVDRLDVGVEEWSLGPESATPAQPAPVFPGAMSSDRLQSPAVTRKGHGVDDGFRIQLGHCFFAL